MNKKEPGTQGGYATLYLTAEAKKALKGLDNKSKFVSEAIIEKKATDAHDFYKKKK